jgi:hypothetical protein
MFGRNTSSLSSSGFAGSGFNSHGFSSSNGFGRGGGCWNCGRGGWGGGWNWGFPWNWGWPGYLPYWGLSYFNSLLYSYPPDYGYGYYPPPYVIYNGVGAPPPGPDQTQP